MIYLPTSAFTSPIPFLSQLQRPPCFLPLAALQFSFRTKPLESVICTIYPITFLGSVFQHHLSPLQPTSLNCQATHVLDSFLPIFFPVPQYTVHCRIQQHVMPSFTDHCLTSSVNQMLPGSREGVNIYVKRGCI